MFCQPAFRPVLLYALALALCAFGSPSDDRPDASCTLQAARTAQSISVDGRLTEPGWQDAPTATGFRQLSPNEGAAPSQRTEVHVLYGADAVYVGATLHDDVPDRIQDRLTRRDDRNQADWFEVSIDSYLDRKTARTFAVNAAGVQRDGIVRGRGLDTSWDGVWSSAVRITDAGWVAELRIPYTMLRFNEGSVQTWGIQFVRRIPRNSEVSEWALVPSTDRSGGVVAEYGRLTGLQNLSPARNVQVAPYTVARLDSEESAASPGTAEVSASYDVGGDVEVSLGSNITLNATINPDFGQVESDPAVLNLSAFEIFFPERRPFFVEGADVFDFGLGGGSELLYTRRIGGAEPVIGASKVTGRTPDGLTFGALGAVTGDAFSPSRTYGAARLRQEIGSYSTAGGMVTTFTGPRGDGTRRSLGAGADWDLRFQGNTYQVSGFASATHRASTASGVPSQTGFSFETEAGRAQGTWTYDVGTRYVGPSFNPNDAGRQRQNNFVRLSGSTNYRFNAGKPFGPFQQASVFSFVGHSWSVREGLSRGLGYFFGLNVDTKNFRALRLRTGGDYLLGGYDLFETRGLGPRAQPRTFSASLSVETDSRRAWQLEPRINLGMQEDGGRELGVSLEADWNASEHLSLRGDVSYSVDANVTDWASNETFRRLPDGDWAIGTERAPPDALDPADVRRLPTGQSRLDAIFASVPPSTGTSYHVPVYGARDTRRLNATLRSTVTLTPDVSVELFGQLFAARGRYDAFRIHQNRDALADFDAYPKRHDFASYSFLSNAVLRWEFRPGSEVFFVWSQSRRDRDRAPFFVGEQPSPYERTTGERLADTFSVFPRNALTLKVRYLLR